MKPVHLAPLLLLLPVAAWAQTDTAPMLDPASAAGAAAILATLGPLAWRLLGLVESLVRDRLTGRAHVAPPAAPMTVGSLLDDRQSVLTAAKHTEEVWRATAAPDGDGQPRLLAHQSWQTRQMRELTEQMRELTEQVQTTSAAQAASTAATASLVAVLRELLAMSPAAEAARSRVRGDR